MEREPKVLVFASCYNHEKFVAEAIESVLNQTYRNIEFLIVNDGSKDGSASVIEKYTYDKRLVFVNLKENTSAVGAFRIINEYISKSDAKYIAGMSTDDKWRLDKLERQISFLENNNSYKACFTWDEMIYENDKSKSCCLPQGYSHSTNKNRFRNLYRLLTEGNFYNGVSAVMVREVYVKLGGFNWAYRNLQDYDMWIRLQLEYPVYLMPEMLTYYRRHDDNLSGTSNVFFRDRNEKHNILDRIMNDIDDETFKRIFFKNFVYYNSNSNIEILAEKISMLMRENDMILKQVAFDLYYKNSNDFELLDLLDEKFGLSTSVFHNMTGGYGLEFALISDYECEHRYSFGDMEALLQFVDNGDYTYEKMHMLQYHSLETLLYLDYQTSKTINSFIRIRDFVWQQQDKMQKNEKNLLITSIEYLEACKDIIKDFSFIAVLPTVSDMFIDNAFTDQEIDLECERVRLFEPKEHRVRGLWEMDMDDVDSVFLYGICNNDYPIDDIIENLSLSTKVFRIAAENDAYDNNVVNYLLRSFDNAE